MSALDDRVEQLSHEIMRPLSELMTLCTGQQAEYASILARLETAERKVEELEQYYATAMLEPCPDEQHCTCVPALRKRAESAEKARDEARQVISRADMELQAAQFRTAHSILRSWLAENPEVTP